MNAMHESTESEREALPCLCCGNALRHCETEGPDCEADGTQRAECGNGISCLDPPSPLPAGERPTRAARPRPSPRWGEGEKRARAADTATPSFRGTAGTQRPSHPFAAALVALLFALGLALTCAHAAQPLPGDSAYQLDLPLVDQDGKAFDFAAGRGRPRLVSMFYSSCKFVCPMIVDTLRNTERALDPAERAKIDVLLVSLDPDTDTPAVLKRLAEQRRIDTPRWRLARTDAAHVRRLAAVLGVQYKQLGPADFSHSTVLVLLDAEGRIVARSDKLGDADPTFVETAKRVLAPR